MNKGLKITLWILIPLIALLLMYFLIPMDAWKQYKENHPSLFEVEDEATPTYWQFCKSYWKAFILVSDGKEDQITYDGGELPEIVITPSKQ